MKIKAAVLVVTTLAAMPTRARAQEAVKPYFLVIVDNSGSMTASTGSGTNSCAREHTRMSDAKCVLQRVVNAYGDAVFGLARFRIDSIDPSHNDATLACPNEGNWIPCEVKDPDEGSCPSTCINCQFSSIDCNGCADSGTGCPAAGGTADRAELLVDIRDGNQADLLEWVNYSVNTCSASGAGPNDPELAADAWTPLAGALLGAKRYYQGNDPDFTSAEPIRGDGFRDCRPYYVILLTDGEETCASDAATVAAATSLRTTDVDGTNHDIRTYAIGLGLTSAATTKLNAVAAAGGTGSAYLATNETTLALAFSQIIGDSLLVEVCNNRDDDCDGLVDEGFTKYCDQDAGEPMSVLCDDPGDDCDGSDDNCFAGTADEPVNACGSCGSPTEICDGADNDCDGFVDEGGVCMGCTPEAEVCDGRDNDCDTMIDEGLTRPCGSDVGVCSPGTEHCAAGAWVGCTGIGPTPEDCDGLDNDCDGVVDGMAMACGHPAVGQCLPGSAICTAGAWGPCVGGVGPGAEGCDLIDNDCDGVVDDDTAGEGIPCDTSCGAGLTECVNGMIVCTGGGSTMPETCNGVDDDCDGLVDEDQPPMGPCDQDGTLCIPGELRCVDGSYQCVGGVPPTVEVCDCLDNDCDTMVDEGELCTGGSACLGEPYCGCARPCEDDEFPCPSGYVCTLPDDPAHGFCVPDLCATVVCDPVGGERYVCREGECVAACDVTTCSPGFVCRSGDGACVEDTCAAFPERCSASEVCVQGTCVANPCAAVTCDAPLFCSGGACIPTCAGVSCEFGWRCDQGVCVRDLCAEVNCPEVCDPADGACVPDLCVDRTCPVGEVCEPVTGDCEPDPCLGVVCPGSGQVCRGGNCFDANAADAGPRELIVATGGGGCACRAAPRPGGGPPGGGLCALVTAALAAAFLARRRS